MPRIVPRTACGLLVPFFTPEDSAKHVWRLLLSRTLEQQLSNPGCFAPVPVGCVVGFVVGLVVGFVEAVGCVVGSAVGSALAVADGVADGSLLAVALGDVLESPPLEELASPPASFSFSFSFSFAVGTATVVPSSSPPPPRPFK
jgi:hypothetical protein